MSLPDFKPPTRLFGLYGPAGLQLDPGDRYRLFAEKIYPLLVEARAELENCYCQDNGRPSVEPVLLLGVTLLQFVEKIPDREAVERLRYHLGWKYALNHEVNEAVFDSTVLVHAPPALNQNGSGPAGYIRDHFSQLPMNDDHLYRDPDYPWDAYLQS